MGKAKRTPTRTTTSQAPVRVIETGHYFMVEVPSEAAGKRLVERAALAARFRRGNPDELTPIVKALARENPGMRTQELWRRLAKQTGWQFGVTELGNEVLRDAEGRERITRKGFDNRLGRLRKKPPTGT
jgi:hypothetical protein